MKGKMFFDKKGYPLLDDPKASVDTLNVEYYFNQPPMNEVTDYGKRLLNLGELNVDIKITAVQFRQEIKRLYWLIVNDQSIANVLNSVWLPLVIPKLTFIRKNIWDIGTIIECYLKAARKSYSGIFNGRKFRYNLQDKLAGGVDVTWGSRHSQLINRVRRGFVYAIYFPSALQGLSIDASLEWISAAPKGWILSGLDGLIAMAIYPDILARGWHTPSIVMSGLLRKIQMHSKEFSNFTPFFKAFNDGISFSKMSNSSFVSGARSCGLLFIG